MQRYELERHVDQADLPGPEKAILRMLLSRIHARTGTIPAHAQPSLSVQASLTGYHRSTVMRHLSALEKAGWITRDRPGPWLARARHLTTAYTIHAPESYPQARRRGGQGLGAERAGARRTEEQGLGAERAGARRRAPHKTERFTERRQTSSSGDGDGCGSLDQIARDELAALTGRQVSIRTAAEAVRLILAGRSPRNPQAYLRRALRADPARYAPPPSGPPPFRDLDPRTGKPRTTEGEDHD